MIKTNFQVSSRGNQESKGFLNWSEAFSKGRKNHQVVLQLDGTRADKDPRDKHVLVQVNGDTFKAGPDFYDENQRSITFDEEGATLFQRESSNFWRHLKAFQPTNKESVEVEYEYISSIASEEVGVAVSKPLEKEKYNSVVRGSSEYVTKTAFMALAILKKNDNEDERSDLDHREGIVASPRSHEAWSGNFDKSSFSARKTLQGGNTVNVSSRLRAGQLQPERYPILFEEKADNWTVTTTVDESQMSEKITVADPVWFLSEQSVAWSNLQMLKDLP